MTLQLEGYTDVQALKETAVTFFGRQGEFVYRAYEWANEELFDDGLPVSLIQWALTPHGGCLGITHCDPNRAVITLHPAIWGDGEMHQPTMAWGGIPAVCSITLVRTPSGNIVCSPAGDSRRAGCREMLD